MDSGSIINYQVCYENQTGYDFLYDVNKHGYNYPDGDLPTLNFDPEFQTYSTEPLTEPAINDFISLILPTYTGQIDNGEFRNMTHQPGYITMDSESDTDSVMINNDDLRELTCSRQEEYPDTDSSVGSGHFDNYPPPQIPSPVYQPYNNQSLPSFDQLVQSTTKHFSSSMRQCVSDNEDDDDESEAIVKKGKRGAKNILLWKFLLDELADKHQKHIRWISCKEGTFRFVDTAEISKMWGAKKRKNDMNFEKLSRGIRHYYKSGFMRREDGTRLVYKFNWKKVPKEYRRRFAL